MIFLWVPETKQRTLEELDYICKSVGPVCWSSAKARYAVGVPTRRHMRYQVFEVLPWAFKRYILRKDVEIAPLYKFQHSY